jgi:hypothetical protein
MLRSAGDP